MIGQSKTIKTNGEKLSSSLADSDAEFKKMLKLAYEESVPKTLYWNDSSFSLPIRLDILPILDPPSMPDNQEADFIVLLATNYHGDTDLNIQFRDKYGLTPTELELVRVLLKGLTPKQIAQQKDRAVSTIKWTLSNIYEKTDTRSQQQLISLAELFIE